MYGIKRHYSRVLRETADPCPIRLKDLEPLIVVIPMTRWDKIGEKAVRFGLLMSDQVKVVTVQNDTDTGFEHIWEEMVHLPISQHGIPVPEVITVHSTLPHNSLATDGLHSRTRKAKSWPQTRSSSARTRGSALVGELPSQPTGSITQAAPVAERKSANCGGKHPLVSLSAPRGLKEVGSCDGILR